MERQPVEKEKPEKTEAEPEEESGGLASLLGKYNDDPTWEEFDEWLKEYRRRVDELHED